MSDLKVRLLLEAQAAAALAALDRTQAELRKTGDAAREAAQAAADGGTGLGAAVTAGGGQAVEALDRVEAGLLGVSGAANEVSAAATLQFRSALVQQAEALDASGRSGTEYAAVLARIRAAYNPVFAASKQYEAALEDIAAAERMGAISAGEAGAARERAAASLRGYDAAGRTLVATNGAVAGSAASVGAQFNDIGVMWAAGQSPFMTAIQQGTQLNQILGGQGLAGAAATARAAFATMFNPFSVGLIAALTLGGTFVQWMFDAGEEAKTVEDHLADVKARTDALAKANETAGRSVAELTAEFGAQAEAIRDLARAQAEVEFRAAARSAGGASRAIVDSFREQGVDVPLREMGDQLALSDMFGLTETGLLSGWMGEEARRTVNSIGAALQGLDLASGLQDDAARLEAMAAAAEVLRQRFQEAAEQAGGISDVENAILQNIVAQQGALARLQAERLQTLRGQAAELLAERAADRGDSPREVRVRTADAELRAETAELRQQAALQALVARYGADSFEVARARALAERAVAEAMLATSGAAAEVRRQYLAAWDAANGLAETPIAKSVSAAQAVALLLSGNLDDAAEAANRVAGADIAGGISAALGPAAALAARLWDAAAGAAAAARARDQLDQMSIEFSPGGQAQLRYGSRTPGGTAEQNALERRNQPATTGGASSGGSSGGGGGAAGDTVASLRAEATETLQELDLAVAAIGEKVRAGITGAGEAADGVAQAKDRAADELAELIAQLAAMGPAGETAAAGLRRALDGLVPAANRLSDALEEGFKAPFADFVSGAASAKDAFADFAGFIQRKLGEIVANQVWDGLIAPLLGGFGGGGLGGGLELVFGGLFGGGFAAGGAPLSAMTNRVVGQPTLFDMGGGATGLLGEAGDEAILPLRGKGALALLPGGGEMRLPLARGARGDLGIALPADLLAAVQPFARGGAPRIALPEAPDLPRRRAGPGSAPEAGPATASPGPRKVSVTLHNNGAPMQAEAEMREDGGDLSIDILMDQIDAAMARRVQTGRGALVGALQRTMGLRRQGQ